jgi:hypothetical protein
MTMKRKRFQKSWLVGICSAVYGLLGATVAANASTYIVTIEQVGSDVVATGSGQLDLTSLTLFFTGAGPGAGIVPNTAQISFATTGSTIDAYDGLFSGPASFGTGTLTLADTTSGEPVFFLRVLQSLAVPTGYISDAALGTSTSTYSNATLTSLGVTPGIYVWTWGPAANQSFTLDIINPIPIPAALPLFATGLGVLGLLGWRRKRNAA